VTSRGGGATRYFRASLVVRTCLGKECLSPPILVRVHPLVPLPKSVRFFARGGWYAPVGTPINADGLEISTPFPAEVLDTDDIANAHVGDSVCVFDRGALDICALRKFLSERNFLAGTAGMISGVIPICFPV